MRHSEYKYHHVGLLTKYPRLAEDYNSEWKHFASGYFESSFGIEWLRFEEDTPIHPLIKNVPHIAFTVKDIKNAIKGHNIIFGPHYPKQDVIVYFIEFNGLPIELIQFNRSEHLIWPNKNKKINSPNNSSNHSQVINYQYHHFGVFTEDTKDNNIWKPEFDNLFKVQKVSSNYEFLKRKQHQAYIAFKVNNLEKAIEDKSILVKPFCPEKGIVAAMIVENDALVQLFENTY